MRSPSHLPLLAHCVLVEHGQRGFVGGGGVLAKRLQQAAAAWVGIQVVGHVGDWRPDNRHLLDFCLAASGICGCPLGRACRTRGWPPAGVDGVEGCCYGRLAAARRTEHGTAISTKLHGKATHSEAKARQAVLVTCALWQYRGVVGFSAVCTQPSCDRMGLAAWVSTSPRPRSHVL